MAIRRILNLCLLLLTIFMPLCVSPIRASGFLVTKVYDGDTVRVEFNGGVLYVMLLGIDAPELSIGPGMPSQPFGHEARDVLAELVLNKEVEIHGYGKAPAPDDKILGVLFHNGININLEMVKRGLAEVYQEALPEGFDITPFLKAETEAKAKGKGMWSQGIDYISPKQWRHSHKSGHQNFSRH